MVPPNSAVICLLSSIPVVQLEPSFAARYRDLVDPRLIQIEHKLARDLIHLNNCLHVTVPCTLRGRLALVLARLFTNLVRYFAPMYVPSVACYCQIFSWHNKWLL